ncbi:MAG: ATP-binding cassette domain-containing protein, partial [Erysipelotrichaceae bacterium]
ILVSHDIPFLNSVINVIYEIENCELTRYTGDYNQYLSMHEMKVAQQNAAYNKQQKEIDDLEDFIARNKARVATRNMASSRQKKLDKMTIISKTKEKIKPVFGFSEDRTPGRVIFETKDLVIGYDEPLSSPLNLVFERNKKVAIKGCNGLGKSTLLKSLFGIIPSISGSVELDPFVTLGYFKQEEIASNKSALQEYWDEFPALNNGEVRSALAKCGLTSDHIESMMSVLSGGENAKVRLAKIMNRPCNVLVLDEPTNHLDVVAKEELKRAIIAYKGSVLLVSHEKEFYEEVVDEVWNIEDWTTKLF